MIDKECYNCDFWDESLLGDGSGYCTIQQEPTLDIDSCEEFETSYEIRKDDYEDF